MSPPGTGKNVLTVGASEIFRQTGLDGCTIANTGADSAMDVIFFSSRGPTSDQRKKPDIMAPGTHIQGAASRAVGYASAFFVGVCDKYWPIGQTLYAWSSGTSHAAPAVAGFCALIRQFHLNQGLVAPSPAMLKAEVVSGSTYMTGVGANDDLWSISQGFGRANMARTFDDAARIRVDQTQILGTTGATFTQGGTTVDAALPFRVVLAWTDVPGPTIGSAFVNNLDLEVTVGSTLYRGNVFTGASSSPGGTADARNNVESVFLPAGTSDCFSIVVRATNIAGDGVPGNVDITDQDFALLVYNGSAMIVDQPDSVTVVIGDPVTFSVTAVSSCPLTYQWRKDGVPIPGETSDTLSIPSTVAGDEGTYDVVVCGCCCEVSAAATLTL